MFDSFEWTEKSKLRNSMTEKHEPIQPFIICEAAKRVQAEVVLDIGANIGFYTVILGNTGSVATVHSFEPVAGPYKELVENVRLNGLAGKCLLHNCALSDTPGKATMMILGEYSGANALASTSIHQGKDAYESIEVNVSSIDEIINFEGKSIIIKLDVEGHELEVLKGADRLLRNNSGVAQVELYPVDRRKDDVIEFMRARNWQKFFVAGPEHYFSNRPEFSEPSYVLDVLEAATRTMIHDRLAEAPETAVRRRIAPGLTLELSPRLSDTVRKALGSVRK